MNPETTLTPGAYTLPFNCRAFVRNGKVIVSLKSGAADIPRCRDCKHLGREEHNVQYRYYASPVCKMQPKPFRASSQKRFYTIRPSDAACDKYEPNDELK